MSKTFLTISALAATALLAACAMNVAPRPQPDFMYKKYPPVMLNVATIEVVQAYQPPSQAPHVDHLLPLPLNQAVAEWARAHFQASGGTGKAVITVKDASMIEQQLPRTTGAEGIVTLDQAQRYDAKVAVEFRSEGLSTPDGATKDGSVTVNLARSMTIGEDSSIQDRDIAWTAMEEKILIDLDASTQTLLQSKMGFLVGK